MTTARSARPLLALAQSEIERSPGGRGVPADAAAEPIVVEPCADHEPSTAVASPIAREWLWRAERIDLSGVSKRVAHEFPKWSHRDLFEAQRDYVRFLALNGLFPDRSITPTKEVDAFWHQHILDTQKYRADCQVLLGRFLEHVPGPKVARAGDDLIELIHEHLRGPSDPRCNFYHFGFGTYSSNYQYTWTPCGVPLSEHAAYEMNHKFSEEVYHDPPPTPGGSRSRSCASSQGWRG